MVLQSWGDAVVVALQDALVSTANFIPLLVGALLVFFVGWVIAVSLGKVVEHVIKALRIDHLLSGTQATRSLERAGFKLDASAFIGGLVRWFLIIVFLLASSTILGLGQVADFLRDVLGYIPNVVVAAFIIIIAAVVADVVEHLMHGTVQALGSRGALVGVMTRWAIWVFAFIAILLQLRIAPTLVETLVTGFVGALALALGLAFGLGGRDTAAAILEKMRREVQK